MNRRLKCGAAIACCLWPLGAQAVVALCNVSASGVAFANYVSMAGGNTDGLGDVAVTCTAIGSAGTGTYTITLGTGSGSYANRTLVSGGHALNYNLYLDTARMLTWGDGSAGSGIVSDSYQMVLTPTTRHYTVFGRIPGAQNQPAGIYLDALVVTVTY